MSFQGKLKRYLLILERLQRPSSFSELHDHLYEHGFELSQRTLQRDINGLRDEFGIEVVYNRPANHYVVASGRDEVEGVLWLLERAQLLELVRNAGNMHELHRYVRFDGLGRLQGIHHIGPLLRAIRERRETLVSYRKFHDDAAKQIRIRPHQLKEYQGRWYVLGPTPKHARPIALGLDRIQELDVLRTRFTRKEQDIADLYGHVIGVDTTAGKPERILLRFDAVQAPYVKALPVHASQRVEAEDRQGLTISLFVMPNFEVRQMLLGWGASVVVLEPDHLARAIRDAHTEAAALYRK